MAGSSTQGPWLFSAGIGASAYVVPTAENAEHPDNHEPKWDAYLECVEDLEPDKRKFNVEEDPTNPIFLTDSSSYSDNSDELAPSKIMEGEF
ncbi:hypothetical protein E2562_021533 [Oryza meyeriana var. granulata]|uniref:Uncharacterized protein n=1 Tax=Oryza meyeriana var. granulata TaxID=110450 RepID=A0A6G1DZD4_9ORYZ|nr:hypothetical protein E2562_021533 [Oryza meyeriana var. granulata]